MERTSATTSDGYLLELSWDKGRGTRFNDFSSELREFGETMTYWFLTVKGDPRVLKRLYDPIRTKGTEASGVRPIAMPITIASDLAVFLWPQTAFDGFDSAHVLATFSTTISTVKIGKLEPKKQATNVEPSLELARAKYKAGKKRRNLQALGGIMLAALLLYLLYVLYLIVG